MSTACIEDGGEVAGSGYMQVGRLRKGTFLLKDAGTGFIPVRGQP